MPPASPTLRACPHCGAHVSLPAGQISEKCAFCDTPLVAWSGEGEPVDLVAPFVLDRAQAMARLKQHLGARFWAPEAVRRLDPRDLDGVLVPFYCFDATAHSDYSARVGIWWYRTRTYTVVVNGKVQTRTQTVRETEWFPVSGSHVASYQDHLVSGSRGLPEAESNELEPFDLGQARPFAPELLSGWMAELPDVGREQAQRTATDELRQRENKQILAFLPGNEKADVGNDTALEVGALRLVLLPVWIATYQHKGRPMRLLVNGQTGEVVGRVPRSWVKIALAIALVVGVVVAILACGGLIAGLAGYLS
jgi:hypothetical protein